MGLRGVHGTAKGCDSPRQQLETLPYVEMPGGEPGPADDASRAAAEERGKFTDGNQRSVLGGRAHRGKPRMSARVSMRPPTVELPTHPYHVGARMMVKATAAALARNVGGGELDPHTGYLLTAAGRAAKWANYYSDLAERLEPGSKEQREIVSTALAVDERASAHLRNAHEYAAKMAAARPRPKNELPPGYVWSEEEEPKP